MNRLKISDKGTEISLKSLSTDEMIKIKKDLKVTPTVYIGKSEEYNLYIYNKNTNILKLPRFYAIKELCGDDKKLADFSFNNIEKIDLKLKNLKLHEIQKIAVKDVCESFLKYSTAILRLGCGMGKTATSIYIISSAKVKTLIVIHRKVLMKEWKKQLEKFCDKPRIGLIHEKNYDVKDKDVIITTVQKIIKYPELYSNIGIGLTILDECFTGDTLITVQINGNLEKMKIREIYNRWKLGEKNINVLSFNIKKQKYELKKVIYGWKKQRNDLLLLEFENENKKIFIETTKNHCFYSNNNFNLKSYGGWIWKSASKMIEGKTVCITDEYKIAKLIKKTEINKELDVFDLEVEDNHNFFAESILVHNCHHLNASEFCKVLKNISTKYMLGLTATPNKGSYSNISHVFKSFIGPLVPDEKFINSNNSYNNQVEVNIYNYCIDGGQLTQQLYIESYKYGERPKPKISSMLTNISQNNERTKKIFEIIVELLKEKRKILIVSDRKTLLRYLGKMCDENDIGYGLFIGGVSEEKMDNGRKESVILGTYPICEEGLNIEDLDTIILATPRKDVEQAIGRIFRKKHPHPAKIIDFVDNFSTTFINQGKFRAKHFRSRKFTISTLKIE